jgi:predicted GNAT family acetyltransferase
MKLSVKAEAYTDVWFLNEASRMSEYLGVFSLLNECEGDFSRWYSVFSKKINSSDALGAYKVCGDTIVSTATVTAVYGDTAIVSGVYTHSSFRGRGYASECLKAVVNELFKRGVKEVYLWCQDDKIQFYKKLGFEICSEIYQGKV